MNQQLLVFLLLFQLMQSTHIFSAEPQNKGRTWWDANETEAKFYGPDNQPFTKENGECYVREQGNDIGIPVIKQDNFYKKNKENPLYLAPNGKLTPHPHSGTNLTGRPPKTSKRTEKGAPIPTPDQQAAATPWPVPRTPPIDPSQDGEQSLPLGEMPDAVRAVFAAQTPEEKERQQAAYVAYNDNQPTTLEPTDPPLPTQPTSKVNEFNTPWWKHAEKEYLAPAAIQVVGQKSLQAIFKWHPNIFHKLTSPFPIPLSEKEASTAVSKLLTQTGKSYYFRTSSFEKGAAQSILGFVIGYGEAQVSTAISKQLELIPKNNSEDSWQRELARTGIDTGLAAGGFAIIKYLLP